MRLCTDIEGPLGQGVVFFSASGAVVRRTPQKGNHLWIVRTLNFSLPLVETVRVRTWWLARHFVMIDFWCFFHGCFLFLLFLHPRHFGLQVLVAHGALQLRQPAPAEFLRAGAFDLRRAAPCLRRVVQRPVGGASGARRPGGPGAEVRR